MTIRLNAKELRGVEEQQAGKVVQAVKRNPLYLILENVYDTYNVGGLFRLADALAVEKIYLCGEMETPPNHKIKKASIGTYKIVPWEYKKTAQEAIEELKQKKVTIYAVEQSAHSQPYTSVKYSFPLAFLVGNETSGVTAETLQLCDAVVEIPMWGVNKSLNVIVSAAIVGYAIIGSLRSSGKMIDREGE